MKLNDDRTSKIIENPLQNEKTPTWNWRDLEMEIALDEESALFRESFLPICQKAFRTGCYDDDSLKILDPSETLQTNGKNLRVYHVGAEGFAEDTHVFIRNENAEGVNNWSLDVESIPWLNEGDFVEFAAKGYAFEYGGFLADIFSVKNQTLISAGLGTDAFAEYTTANTVICRLKNQSIFYVEIRLGQKIRYGFVLRIG